MECLQTLIQLVSRLDSSTDGDPYLTQQMIGSLMSSLLKQSVERIDRVRECAGGVICALIYDTDTLPYPATVSFAMPLTGIYHGQHLLNCILL